MCCVSVNFTLTLLEPEFVMMVVSPSSHSEDESSCCIDVNILFDELDLELQKPLSVLMIGLKKLNCAFKFLPGMDVQKENKQYKFPVKILILLYRLIYLFKTFNMTGCNVLIANTGLIITQHGGHIMVQSLAK